MAETVKVGLGDRLSLARPRRARLGEVPGERAPSPGASFRVRSRCSLRAISIVSGRTNDFPSWSPPPIQKPNFRMGPTLGFSSP